VSEKIKKLDKITLTTVAGNEFTVKVGTPSLKRRQAVRELAQIRMKALAEIDNSYPLITPLKEDATAEQKAYAESTEFQILATEKNSLIYATQDEYTIKMAKVVLDEKSASDYQSAFGGEWDGEFWSSQNIFELEACLNFFRSGSSE
jgi:hypothetical protein